MAETERRSSQFPKVTYDILGGVTVYLNDGVNLALTWEDAESFARELLSCIEGAKQYRPRSNDQEPR